MLVVQTFMAKGGTTSTMHQKVPCCSKQWVVSELFMICPKAFIIIPNGWLGENKLTTNEWVSV